MYCSICWNKLSESPDSPPDAKRPKLCQSQKNSGNVSTPCGHAFHRTCVEDWLKKDGSCPTCRGKTTSSSLRPLFLEFDEDETKPKDEETKVSQHPGENKSNSQKGSTATRRPNGSNSKSVTRKPNVAKYSNSKPKASSYSYSQNQSQSSTWKWGSTTTTTTSQTFSQGRSQTFITGSSSGSSKGYDWSQFSCSALNNSINNSILNGSSDQDDSDDDSEYDSDVFQSDSDEEDDEDERNWW